MNVLIVKHSPGKGRRSGRQRAFGPPEGAGRMPDMDEKLNGVVERVTFHNPENGFAVLRVQVTGRRGLVTLVGSLPSIVAGEHVEATGVWVQDREHGPQFKASELKTAPPHTLAGIEK